MSASQDVEGALASYARAVQTLQGVVDRDHRHSTARAILNHTHWNRAEALGTLGRHTEAADDWQRAAELDDGSPGLEIRLGHAVALARAGNHAQAAAAAGELAAIDEHRPGALYDLACVQSLCAAVAKDDAVLVDKYAVDAIGLLKRARAAGFFDDAANVEHMGKDSDLDALRQRDDFRKFVEGLKAAPPPKPE